MRQLALTALLVASTVCCHIGSSTARFSTLEDPAGLRFLCNALGQKDLCLEVMRPDCDLLIISDERAVAEESLVEVSFPPEANQSIQMSCSDGTTRRIQSARDLEGYVEVRNTREALEFLRFFSTFYTAHLVETDMLEIFIGDQQDCPFSCLSADRWQDLELQEPTVLATDQGYLVKRSIVRPTPSPTSVTAYRVVERVSRDGQVELIFEEPVPLELLDRARLYFPNYL